jgi:hypothetical protein
MFLTKRLLLAAFALAILIPLAGCGRRCCHGSSSSFAPPCCPPTTLPPGAVAVP